MAMCTIKPLLYSLMTIANYSKDRTDHIAMNLVHVYYLLNHEVQACMLLYPCVPTLLPPYIVFGDFFLHVNVVCYHIIAMIII